VTNIVAVRAAIGSVRRADDRWLGHAAGDRQWKS
jgi:hypothetical protein